ncbi:hypothetical protein AAF712_010726 [Marasmius tenuissimus]|uniref:Uncharacterized protein n=1 Tax=Marasmius tenuissimus TaxID=585030 RepID=A0ABR2ZM46_9AGAR
MGIKKITHRHLTDLHLVAVGRQSGIHAAMYWLIAPALTHLTISSSGPDQSALSRFLRTTPRLTYMSIARVEMRPSEFDGLLTRLQLLNDLSFGVVGGITNEYLSIFSPGSPDEGPKSILPNLRKLSLLPAADTDSRYSVNTLLDVLEARWRVAASISNDPPRAPNAIVRLVSVVIDEPIESERLDLLRIEGLSVEMWRPDNVP